MSDQKTGNEIPKPTQIEIADAMMIGEPIKSIVRKLAFHYDQQQSRIRELEGAMDSQDNREREAGEKCDIPYSEHGCDWPDAAADRIIFLRSENQRLRQAVEELIEAGQAMRDSDCSEDACALWADIYARASALAAKGGKS